MRFGKFSFTPAVVVSPFPPCSEDAVEPPDEDRDDVVRSEETEAEERVEEAGVVSAVVGVSEVVTGAITGDASSVVSRNQNTTID